AGCRHVGGGQGEQAAQRVAGGAGGWRELRWLVRTSYPFFLSRIVALTSSIDDVFLVGNATASWGTTNGRLRLTPPSSSASWRASSVPQQAPRAVGGPLSSRRASSRTQQLPRAVEGDRGIQALPSARPSPRDLAGRHSGYPSIRET